MCKCASKCTNFRGNLLLTYALLWPSGFVFIVIIKSNVYLNEDVKLWLEIMVICLTVAFEDLDCHELHNISTITDFILLLR